MARLRTIKPSFFLNEELASVPALGRLLFAGLWCLADRRGRLEDRPARIKAEVLPYDKCDANKLLAELNEKGFIQRYEINGQRYIYILNFEKHQSPHYKENDSVLPPPPGHIEGSSAKHGSRSPHDRANVEPTLNQGQPNESAHRPSVLSVYPSSVNGVLETGESVLPVDDASSDASSPPAQLRAFDDVLRGVRGYAPDRRLYSTIVERWPHVHYESEALKLADSLRRSGKPATAAKIINWFEGIREPSRSPVNGNQPRNRPISHAESVSDPNRFDDEPMFQDAAEEREQLKAAQLAGERHA